MIDRLSQLLDFYEQDPNDPFNLYALALEYRKNDAPRAAEAFGSLLRHFPDYVPTYYQAAQFYAELGRSDDARRTYETGIETAQRLGKAQALRELRSAYEQWLEEEDY